MRRDDHCLLSHVGLSTQKVLIQPSSVKLDTRWLDEKLSDVPDGICVLLWVLSWSGAVSFSISETSEELAFRRAISPAEAVH
jgi:hypothetical protein